MEKIFRDSSFDHRLVETLECLGEGTIIFDTQNQSRKTVWVDIANLTAH